MKTVIGWIVSWCLYWMGDLACRQIRFDAIDRLPIWLIDANYKIYNWLITRSWAAQKWGGKGPWLPVNVTREG